MCSSKSNHLIVCRLLVVCVLHVRVYSIVCIGEGTCTHTNVHVSITTHTCTCTHIHSYAHKHTCMCTHTHTHTHILTHTHTHTHTHRCVYLPSNGALFVGYVIVVAFISSPLDLIRVPELIVYVYRRLTAKTRLEKEKALSKVAVDQFMYIHVHVHNKDVLDHWVIQLQCHVYTCTCTHLYIHVLA